MQSKTSIRQGLTIIFIAVVVGLSINLLRENSLPLIAHGIPEADQLFLSDDTDTAQLVLINFDQAVELFRDGTVFIDARESQYFDEGHIKGAWNIGSPLELAFKLDSLQGKNDLIVTYCGEADCGSSENLAFTLQDLGFTRIFIYSGGWFEWSDAGMPVE